MSNWPLQASELTEQLSDSSISIGPPRATLFSTKDLLRWTAAQVVHGLGVDHSASDRSVSDHRSAEDRPGAEDVFQRLPNYYFASVLPFVKLTIASSAEASILICKTGRSYSNHLLPPD